MRYTANYNLPQYEENDITSWLTTFNGAMEDIDTGMHTNAEKIALAEQNIQTLQQEDQTQDTRIEALEDTTQEHATRIAALEGQQTSTNQTVTDYGVRLKEAETKIAGIVDNVGQFYKGVLSAGETVLTLVVGEVTEFTMLDIYVSKIGVEPTAVQIEAEASGSQNTVKMTFDVQEENITVAVITRNPTFVDQSGFVH